MTIRLFLKNLIQKMVVTMRRRIPTTTTEFQKQGPYDSFLGIQFTDEEFDRLNVEEESATRLPQSEEIRIATEEEDWSDDPPINTKNFVGVWDDLEEVLEDSGTINFLGDNRMEYLNVVDGSTKWVKIDAIVDSGASDSVGPTGMAPWIKTKASEGSKRGQNFHTACGGEIPNEGEKRVPIVTREGRRGMANFQCADVSRPLMSVSRICDQGNCVVFTATGGFVVDKQGSRTAFRRANNVYVLDMWTKVEPVVEETKPEKTEAQSFRRQGQ